MYGYRRFLYNLANSIAELINFMRMMLLTTYEKAFISPLYIEIFRF